MLDKHTCVLCAWHVALFILEQRNTSLFCQEWGVAASPMSDRDKISDQKHMPIGPIRAFFDPVSVRVNQAAR